MPTKLLYGAFVAMLLSGCVTAHEEPAASGGWELVDEPEQAPLEENEDVDDGDASAVVVHRHEDRSKSVNTACALGHIIIDVDDPCTTEPSRLMTRSTPYNLYLRFPGFDNKWHMFDVRRIDTNRYPKPTWKIGFGPQQEAWQVDVTSTRYVMFHVFPSECQPLGERDCEYSHYPDCNGAEGLSDEEFLERYSDIEARVEQSETGIVRSFERLEVETRTSEDPRERVPIVRAVLPIFRGCGSYGN
jgi:hypothetical protein